MNPQDPQSNLEDRIQEHLKLSEVRVLCCLVLSKLDNVFVNLLRIARPSMGLLALSLFSSICFIAIIINTLSGSSSRDESIKIVSLSVITTITISVVKHLRDVLFPIFIDLAINKVMDVQGKRDILEWLNRYNNLSRQIFWSALGALFTELLLAWAWFNSNFYLSPGVFILLGVTVFIGVQLPYWTYAIIHAFSILSKYRIRIYSLDPSEDPLLNLLHRVTMQTLLLGSLIVLAFTLSTYWTFLRDSPTVWVRIAFIAWYLIGLVFAIILFIMPSLYISRIIESEKQRLLIALQEKIEKLYMEMEMIDKVKLEQIEKAWAIYKMIKNTADSTVSWSSIRTFLTSIGIQSLPIIGIFVDWQTVLSILSP